MMNFFAHQDKAQRNTKWLVFLFILAVLGTVLAVNAVVYGVLFFSGMTASMTDEVMLRDMPIWQYISLGVLGVILLGTLMKLWMLRGGGQAVARMVKARRLHMDTQSLPERQFINIVEEMAIASGMSMPLLYVMDNELGINAFVAGTKPSDTVMVVTEGALHKLTRDEMQGVVGHEFSHIFNGDMLINIRLMGVLAGILAIGQIGRFILFSGRTRTMRVSSSRSSNRSSASTQGAMIAIALGIFAVGYIGVFFGSLIKAALSRQREFLADAYAVQYTRNPDGIAGALIKIKYDDRRSHLMSKNSEDISHMCFGESMRRFFNVFNTHPPLDTRIQRINNAENFEAEYLNQSILAEHAKEKAQAQAAASPQQPTIDPVTMMAGVAVGAMAVAKSEAERTQAVISNIGVLNEENVNEGVKRHQQIPANLRTFAHDSYQVQVLLIALLLPEKAALMAEAETIVTQSLGAAAWTLACEIQKETQPLERTLYLPLVEIAMPALVQNHDEVIHKLMEAIHLIVKIDKKIVPLEFAIMLLIRHHASGYTPNKKYRNPERVIEEIATVLSFVLAASKMPSSDQVTCFKLAIEKFTAQPITYDRQRIKPSKVQLAVEKLNGLTPSLKQTLVEALSACVLYDKAIQVEELELFRAIVGCLDCPVPPLNLDNKGV